MEHAAVKQLQDMDHVRFPLVCGSLRRRRGLPCMQQV
jgi:hypothetical protein